MFSKDSRLAELHDSSSIRNFAQDQKPLKQSKGKGSLASRLSKKEEDFLVLSSVASCERGESEIADEVRSDWLFRVQLEVKKMCVMTGEFSKPCKVVTYMHDRRLVETGWSNVRSRSKTHEWKKDTMMIVDVSKHNPTLRVEVQSKSEEMVGMFVIDSASWVAERDIDFNTWIELSGGLVSASVKVYLCARPHYTFRAGDKVLSVKEVRSALLSRPLGMSSFETRAFSSTLADRRATKLPVRSNRRTTLTEKMRNSVVSMMATAASDRFESKDSLALVDAIAEPGLGSYLAFAPREQQRHQQNLDSNETDFFLDDGICTNMMPASSSRCGSHGTEVVTLEKEETFESNAVLSDANESLSSNLLGSYHLAENLTIDNGSFFSAVEGSIAIDQNSSLFVESEEESSESLPMDLQQRKELDLNELYQQALERLQHVKEGSLDEKLTILGDIVETRRYCGNF
jgi:hypothetical protein